VKSPRPELAPELIDTIKDGDLVFAFYPEQNWLTSLKYVSNAVAAD
jgi:hypothetical protein